MMAMRGTSDRHRMASKMRERGATYREIGERIGVSHTRAGQLVKDYRSAMARAGRYGNLSTRALNCLANHFGPDFTQDQVAAVTPERLLKVRGLGRKTRAEIMRWAGIPAAPPSKAMKDEIKQLRAENASLRSQARQLEQYRDAVSDFSIAVSKMALMARNLR